MIRKIYVLSVFKLLFAFSVMAQNGYITGTLVDNETQEPILGASVRVLQQADSTFVSGQATRLDGTFSIAVNDGSYIVHMSFVGYDDVFRNVQINNAVRRAELGTIAMTTDAVLLDEAVVTAMAPEIIMRGDTIEFNADAFRVQEGAVVEELLRQLPGVEVDDDGRITVHGRRVNRIMVDDEEFFSTDPTVASQNLPARMVERVQVAERRSDRARRTGFDDGEEETIINLVTRPGMREALIGEARAGFGQDIQYGYDRYGGRAMLNYMRNRNRYTLFSGLNNTNNIGFTGGMGARLRGGGGGANRGVSTLGNLGGDFVHVFSDQFRLGGNIFYRHNDTYIDSTVETQRLRPGGNIIEDEHTVTREIGNNYNMNLRMEWRPDEMTEILFRPTASFSNDTSSVIRDFTAINEITGALMNYGDSRRLTAGSSENVGGSLNISRRLGREDRVLNIQLDGSTGGSVNESRNISNTFFPGTPTPPRERDQLRYDTRNNYTWRTSISYVEPLGNNNYIQLAYTFRQNRTESDRNTYSIDAATGLHTVWEHDYSLRTRNNFVNQIIEANFRADRGVFRYQVGFSVRPSSSHSIAHRGDVEYRDVTIHHTNFAPVARLNFRWSRSHTLELLYNGITEQPTIDQLSPVRDISNPLNEITGNPNLRPSFTHEITTRYQLANPERARSLSLTGSFRYFTNAIVDSTFIDDSGRRESTFANVGSGNWNSNMNLTINSPVRDGSRFSLSSTSRISYNHVNGFVNATENLSRRTDLSQIVGLNYRGEIFDFSLRGNIGTNRVRNSFDEQRDRQFHNYGGTLNARVFLPWRLTIASDINYAATGGDDLPRDFQLNEWIWNASIQKTLFRQNNGTLAFNIHDILQQRRTIQRNVTANFIQDTRTNTITSFFMVSFIYRFNIFRGGATRENMMPQHHRGGGQRMMQPGHDGHGGSERVIIREGGGGRTF